MSDTMRWKSPSARVGGGVWRKGSAGADDVLREPLERLGKYVEGEGFAGYDPYDALNGWVPFRLGGRWAGAVWTQIHKRNPVNLRPVLGIGRGRNPKGIGLFLAGYSKLRSRKNGEEIARELFEWLMENRSAGFAGTSWGYNFDWVNPVKTVEAGVPSAVVTAFVAKGIFAYFERTGDLRAREAILGCCEYVLEELPRTETVEGTCFSYTHLKRDCCFNANMLAAEILAMGYYLGGEEKWGELARRALLFTIAHQKADGRWNYSRDWKTGRERAQIDFHQGFVLDSIDAVARLTDFESEEVEKALEKGTAFYREAQFFPDGRSKWRLPKEWPVEIHNQAQGILTMTRLRRIRPDYLPFAETIADWTIRNMQDRRGYFYYRKYPRFTNKIPYMRWAQAWMFLALVELTEALKEG